MKTLSITRPDDWHVHFRDLELLKHTVVATARNFSRALVMPNLVNPLTQITDLLAYRSRIMQARGRYHAFEPYMTLYLNEAVSVETIAELGKFSFILGAKFYPAKTTTHSHHGAPSLRSVYPLLEAMQALDLVLQVHGEVAHGDVFDREALFLVQQLLPLLKDFPKLRVVLEHISTKEAVDFVREGPLNLAATITAHHLYYNRNQMFGSGLNPHYYCLPILKREADQRALQGAATSGSAKFFAGTDSAPHEIKNKESSCGCAGIYSAPYAVPIYAEVFDNLEKLDCLNDFLSKFGADFYRLPQGQETLHLIKQSQQVPLYLEWGAQRFVPIAAGASLEWSVSDD